MSRYAITDLKTGEIIREFHRLPRPRVFTARPPRIDPTDLKIAVAAGVLLGLIAAGL